MRIYKLILVFVTLGCFIFLTTLVSCSNSPDEIKPKSSVVELINSQPNLSTYKQAIEITGLSSFLVAGNLTYLMPTNAAFSKFLLDNNYSTLAAVPVPVLKEILMNHFMSGLQTRSALATGYFQTLAKGTASATNSLSLYVASSGNDVVFNGISKIITADIIANNGLIHVVDAVIILPTILLQLTANELFSTLLIVLTNQNQATPINYFKNTLTDVSTKTFFAPTNAAFSSLNSEFNYTATNPIASSLQNQILRYHISTGNNYFLNSFANNQTILTNQGINLTVQLSNFTIQNSVQLRDANNRLASITYKNIQCTNGMIHIIDKVLKP